MSEHLQMQVHVCVHPCLLRCKVHIKLTIPEPILCEFVLVLVCDGGCRGLILINRKRTRHFNPRRRIGNEQRLYYPLGTAAPYAGLPARVFTL